MDALFISGTYVILPFILYISMNIFLKEQVNVITLGYGNYIEYIFNTDTILTFLSLPYAALRNVAYLFDYSQIGYPSFIGSSSVRLLFISPITILSIEKLKIVSSVQHSGWAIHSLFLS